MKRNKKQNIKLFALILILFLGIGYATLTTTLKINGTVDVSKASWDVHFENVNITDGSVTANPAPTTDGETTTEITYTINFTKPGDFFEFTTDIANDGTIDAMIDVISNKVYSSNGQTEIQLPGYLTSSTTYNDGTPIQQNQMITHETTEKIKVRIEFKKDIQASDLPSSGDTTIVFKLRGEYKQADENAIPVRVDFANDSWDDIIALYNNNNLKSLQTAMENGTTREVQLDLDNNGTAETTAHLRIANLSTPVECKTSGFSQSACGFVIEFADSISDSAHRMNKFDFSNPASINGDGNKGGWEYSDMRAYLNSTIYAAGNIDYSTSGIYNALPSNLKEKIINTTVISGHGNRDTSNFTTTDKIYLLSTHEIWEDMDGNQNSGIDYYDTAYSATRQLDYYHSKGVTTAENYSVAKKNYNNTSWVWSLRTARSNDYHNFFSVDADGIYGGGSSYDDKGVSPAFRIAKQN